MFVLGVVVIWQHRGAHVLLEFLQREAAPLVARPGSASRQGDPTEPPLGVQREAASVSKFSGLMHDEGDPLLEVLESLLELVAIRPRRAAGDTRLRSRSRTTQTDNSHHAIISNGKTYRQAEPHLVLATLSRARKRLRPFTMTSVWVQLST